MTNPLRVASTLPHAAVPFDRIETSHFLPALDEALAEARVRLDQIKSSAAPANYHNTIVALEEATAGVYDIAYVFSNLRSAHGDSAMHALAKVIMPKLMALESDINLDAALFARVRTVHDQKAEAQLAPEQKTLLERTYRGFKRGGSLLTDDGKAKLRKIDEELSTLGPQFAENVLKATNAYRLVIKDTARLKGLPDSAKEAAAQTARENDETGAWHFTLHGPSVLPFLKYADDRALRQELWTAFNARAVAGEFANGGLVRSIASLRFARARLLGFDSHAHFQMEERMAEHPDKVKAFLDRLLAKSRAAAEREMAELSDFAKKGGAPVPLMPWDYAYWANKLKEQSFHFNAEELRPYFKLENVLDGAFEVASRLYDLRFSLTDKVPVYAPDVACYEAFDATTGAFMGLFYVDFFPRATKGGGAWATRFRPQERTQRGDQRPHVSIVCNFTKPTPTKPSLLTYQEVNTLFHEFGHALHSLLSKCTHRSLSCTNVYRDFVELPSQILENWIRERECLALFARHFETGAVIPEALVHKLIASENFHAAYLMMRQLRFAYLDLAWYAQDPAAVTDVEAFEKRAVKATDLLPDVSGTNLSSSFEHIFSGGYSAGYYGYKWAEVLDADAFELFKERGIFDRGVAERFRKSVLERGGSEHPMRLYKEFRGREPDPDALLRRSHLI